MGVEGSAVEHNLIDVFKSLWRVGGRGLRVEAGRPERRLFHWRCSDQHLVHNKHSKLATLNQGPQPFFLKKDINQKGQLSD